MKKEHEGAARGHATDREFGFNPSEKRLRLSLLSHQRPPPGVVVVVVVDSFFFSSVNSIKLLLILQ